jgi:hypothetical protein
MNLNLSSHLNLNFHSIQVHSHFNLGLVRVETGRWPGGDAQTPCLVSWGADCWDRGRGHQWSDRGHRGTGRAAMGDQSMTGGSTTWAAAGVATRYEREKEFGVGEKKMATHGYVVMKIISLSVGDVPLLIIPNY